MSIGGRGEITVVGWLNLSKSIKVVGEGQIFMQIEQT